MRFSELTIIADNSKEILQSIGEHWDESERTFPQPFPDFLKRDVYRKDFDWSGLDEEVLPRLDATAAKIIANPELCHLAWHCYQKLYHYDSPSFRDWPLFEDLLGEDGGIFYKLVALGAIPLVKAKFNSLNIPEAIAADTCKTIHDASDVYDRARSNPRTLYWLRNYTDGKIFRIGRLEYRLKALDNYKFEVYEHRKSGKILALAISGLPFDQKGFCLISGEDRSQAAFVSELVHENTGVSGNPIDPVTGTAVNKTVKLNANEWNKILGDGNMVLETHIPSGGKMQLQMCKESMENATHFYRRYFPEVKVLAFVSASWIFYSYYEKALPTSNIAAWMQELYLLPHASNGRSGVYFLFGRDDGDIAEYPRDNSVRKVMVEAFEAGEKLHAGGMFFLTEHLPYFGLQPYRNSLKTDILKYIVSP